MRIDEKAIYVGIFYEELKDKVVRIHRYPNDSTACYVLYRDVVYECCKKDIIPVQKPLVFTG
jgi:hypothetical protein